MNVDEQILLGQFRQLPLEGQKELREIVSSLLKKYTGKEEEVVDPVNRCTIVPPIERPENKKEPFFTE